MRAWFLAILWAIASSLAWGMQTHGIPLDHSAIPADDLIYKGRILSAEEAHALHLSGIDLSQLSPSPNALWSENPDPSPSIPIKDGETVHFQGTIHSNKGVMFFNAHQGSHVYKFYLDKHLHSALLRKALLQRLGYRIPGMKYLKEVFITFSSSRERNKFLTDELPFATLGAASRWIGKHPRDLPKEQLTVKFHDVIAFLPLQSDHYNVAMGVPPKVLTGRTLRALLLPYALLAVRESINKFPWSIGHKHDGHILLKHFAVASMETTIDDARWILTKMSFLSRKDFEDIVHQAAYPPEVAALLVEKIISRRNTLMKIFSIPTKALPFDPNVTRGDHLVGGKLLRQRWEGYASFFAHGDAESPFKDLEYIGYSLLQSSAITSLVNKINEEMVLFDLESARKDFFQQQFEKFLDELSEFGEIKEVSVKSWDGPILNAKLIGNRKIIVGRYMGTNHLLQVADTLGFGITPGWGMGVENDEHIPFVGMSGEVALLRTFVHMRPLLSLKKIFKEPYGKLLVPVTKRQLVRRFEEVAQLQSRDMVESERETILDELFKEIYSLLKKENLSLSPTMPCPRWRCGPTAILS